MYPCIYNEWRGFFGWTSHFRSLFARHWKEQESSSIRTVPFVLVDGKFWPQSDLLSCFSFLLLLKVGLLDEEKILPVGKEITVVGLVILKNEIPEVMACKDLPFFL
ncbi:hypothetical protein LXL04_026298 [Taraxacum kok-saghyz]